VVMLVISYHFQAQNACEFTRQEFVQGMTNLKCDSIPRLSSQLPALRQEMQDPDTFRVSAPPPSPLLIVHCFRNQLASLHQEMQDPHTFRVSDPSHSPAFSPPADACITSYLHGMCDVHTLSFCFCTPLFLLIVQCSRNQLPYLRQESQHPDTFQVTPPPRLFATAHQSPHTLIPSAATPTGPMTCKGGRGGGTSCSRTFISYLG